MRKYILTNNKFSDWQQIKIADENDPKHAMRSQGYHSQVSQQSAYTRQQNAMHQFDGLSTEERQLYGDSEVYWFNKKTFEKTIQHPGKKLYQANRKALRKRAE